MALVCWYCTNRVEEEEGEEEGVLATEHARSDSRSEARVGNHKHARLLGPEIVLQSSV